MYIIYEGASTYDGKPIVVIATKNSKNPKTGAMWQLWIMRQDIAPHDAVKTGDDASVCGKCPLRPLTYKANGLRKPCYVRTFQAPLSVWRKYRRDGYQYITLEAFRKILQGDGVRLGSYGDPASVPFGVWEKLGIGSGEFTHTSYTHGYLVDGFDQRNLTISMVSLDPITQQMPVLPEGRSFRVINSVDQLQQGEILCPASKEQGFKTTCAQCGLCGGLSRKAKNIAIVMH
jgi:hypothetical protein